VPEVWQCGLQAAALSDPGYLAAEACELPWKSNFSITAILQAHGTLDGEPISHTLVEPLAAELPAADSMTTAGNAGHRDCTQSEPVDYQKSLSPYTTSAVNDHNVCHECHQTFVNTLRLDDHAKLEGHAAYACPEEDCPSTFARADILGRHTTSHGTNTARFPCLLCKHRRGLHAFKRKDHL